MTLLNIIDRLFNQRKQVEIEGNVKGDVALEGKLDVEKKVTVGSDLEVDGKIVVNAVGDINVKEKPLANALMGLGSDGKAKAYGVGNGLSLDNGVLNATGGGSKLYKHTLTNSNNKQFILFSLKEDTYTKETLIADVRGAKILSSYFLDDEVSPSNFVSSLLYAQYSGTAPVSVAFIRYNSSSTSYEVKAIDIITPSPISTFTDVVTEL